MPHSAAAPPDLSIELKPGLRDARWAVFQLVKRGWISGWRSAFLIAVLCSGAYVYWAADTDAIRLGAGIFLVVFPAFAIFALVIFPWIQAAASLRAPIMQSPIHHTFSENGLNTKFSGGNLAVEWRLLRRAEETRRYVGIWGERGTPVTIPKAQLTDGELTSLRNILRYYLPGDSKPGG